MNAIKSNPKTTLLLGAALEVLHYESQEWIANIDFWKAEINFFDDLLRNIVSIDKNKREYAEMLKGLDQIHQDLISDLEARIIEHEQILSRLEKGEKGISDAEYREPHRHLRERMDMLMSELKVFKKIVFAYVKNELL